MELCRYFPKPSDRMGALWTLTSIEDIFIIEFGPAGTTHFAIEGAMQLNANQLANIYTTDLDETDISLGKQDRLEATILEIDKIHSPKYIFIMGSSISAIIGSDIESVCYEMGPSVRAKLIPVDTGGYLGDYSLGIEKSLRLLCENCLLENRPAKKSSYNILGNTIDSYNFKDDLKELKDLLRNSLGLEANTIFTADTSIDEIENTLAAQVNIVLRYEALDSAIYLKEKYKMDYIYRPIYSAENTSLFLNELADLLELDLNMDYLQERMKELRRAQMEFKMATRDLENKDLIIHGQIDKILGLRDLAEELGLRVIGLVTDHSLNKKALEALDSKTQALIREDLNEMELDKYMEDKEVFLYMGDGTGFRFRDQARHIIQISNPNLTGNNLLASRPFMGYNGVLNLISSLLEMEKKKVYGLS